MPAWGPPGEVSSLLISGVVWGHFTAWDAEPRPGRGLGLGCGFSSLLKAQFRGDLTQLEMPSTLGASGLGASNLARPFAVSCFLS